jgi:phasin family protein
MPALTFRNSEGYIALQQSPERSGAVAVCSSGFLTTRLREAMPAESNVTSIEHVEDQMRQGYSDLAGMYKGNADAMMAAGQAMISGYQTLNAEMLAFLQSRVKDGLATSQRIAECQSPQTAMELQLDYGKATLQAYVDEFDKVVQLSGRVMTDAFGPLKSRTEAVVDKATSSLAA